MDNWEQYQTAYQAADQKTKDRLHSSLIPECVETAVQKFELDPSHKKVLLQLFANKVVGIMDEAATTEAMRSAGIPAATVISKEISQCITTKTPAIPDTSLVEEDNDADDTNNPHSTPQTTPSTPIKINQGQKPLDQDTLAAELAATEAEFKQLQPIRTMAHDMETLRTDDEPVHQAASQESILNGQGNAQKIEQARWGTPEK